MESAFQPTFYLRWLQNPTMLAVSRLPRLSELAERDRRLRAILVEHRQQPTIKNLQGLLLAYRHRFAPPSLSSPPADANCRRRTSKALSCRSRRPGAATSATVAVAGEKVNPP